MPSPSRFKSTGAIYVPKDSEWTTTDLPAISPGTIDLVRVVEAPRIWFKELDQDGEQVLDNGIPKYIKSNQRGVRILITSSRVTYTANTQNVPTIYREGEEIVLEATNTYKFIDACVVEHGESI